MAVLVYVSRVLGLPLLDASHMPLGQVVDVILAPAVGDRPPTVTGFVVAFEGRRIFVNAARVHRLDPAGVLLQGGAVDIRHFHDRPGEILVHETLLDRRSDDSIVNDIGLEPLPKPGGWVVATVSLRRAGPLRRRSRARIVPWHDVKELFDVGEIGRLVASLRDLHPADLADRLRSMSLARRRQVATALEDAKLADVLEELPELDQLEIVQHLDTERLADLLEEMAPDDAADLLGEMSGPLQGQLLDAMESDDARSVRRLLLYDSESAGGLMTPEPVVLVPGATVAEALARLRSPKLAPAHATCVFVAEMPTETPTGRYRGVVGIQRLLREPPSTTVDDCVERNVSPVDPSLPATKVAAVLAAYNLVAVPVCDDAGRLLGAVTVDDVLDRALPAGWRDERLSASSEQ